ncbi:MAG TPA: adenylosuccinate lyase, partial [Gemmatimonadales bacterium]|nr:adenylosuccinate lyase [Gemmatimonadales bacterium]
LPEAFLAVDAILILAENIARGLEVREDVVQRHVQEQMPFMATERWLMLGVEAGGDRQALHEVVRKHSLKAAEQAAKGGPNDLMERLGTDAAFRKLDAAKLQAELDPARYVGRSPQQVDEFVAEYLRPLVLKARPHAMQAGTTEIRV